MNRREQDILDQIEEKTKDIKIPEKLMPDQIERVLKERSGMEEPPEEKNGLGKIPEEKNGLGKPPEEKNGLGKPPEEGDGSGRRIRRMPYRIGVLAAACLVLVVGIAVFRQSGNETAGEAAGRMAGSSAESAQSDSAVSEGGTSESGAEESSRIDAAEGDPAETAGSYDDIYAYIEALQEERENEISLMDGGVLRGRETTKESAMASAESAAGTAAASVEDSAASGAGTGGGDYSSTNVRQEGVDEGDVVKTDGIYLYVLSENGKRIGIVDTRGGMKEVGEIKAGSDSEFSEFYLLAEEKKLVAIRSVYEEEEKTAAAEESGGMEAEDDVLRPLGSLSGLGNKTEAVTYSLADPEKPKKLGSVVQSGSYASSRVSGGCLYLFTEYWPADGARRDKPETYIPLVCGELLREKDILLPPFRRGCMYELVTAVSLDEPSKAADSKALFTDGGNLYVSNKNIYYYETEWDEGDERMITSIRRIGYEGERLSKAVQGEIKGYINDSFSIDEDKGYLRVVTTYGDTNSVYVLDGKLKVTGKIEGLAKDERVYSARFFGDTGYFVTFRETDPLFSVDLSDPEKPRILGQLKIPGFSEYLHFYGEDKLLGIGMAVEEEAQVTDGVKLSMFDISDRTDVKEENTFVLDNVYGTSVAEDYRAALVDAGKNRIGFAGYTEGGMSYYLFSYDAKEGFHCDMEEELNGNSWSAARGLYISDILYVVQGNVIEAYSLKDYKKVDDLIL